MHCLGDSGSDSLPGGARKQAPMPKQGFLLHYSLRAMLNRSTSQRFSDGKNTLHVSSSHSVIPALCQRSAGVLKHKTQKPASKAGVGICETEWGHCQVPTAPALRDWENPNFRIVSFSKPVISFPFGSHGTLQRNNTRSPRCELFFSQADVATI